MPARVAEHHVRLRRFGPKVLFRVDLHGISVFGPGDEHRLLRWEWIEEVAAEPDVVVRSPDSEIRFPAGAFGVDTETLARCLRSARNIGRRTDAIGELTGPMGDGDLDDE